LRASSSSSDRLSFRIGNWCGWPFRTGRSIASLTSSGVVASRASSNARTRSRSMRLTNSAGSKLAFRVSLPRPVS